MEEISKLFEKVEDTRHKSYVKHKMSDILTVVMCAVLSGLDSLDGIQEYSAGRAEFFREKLGMNQMPSRATYARILSMVDGDAVGKIMAEFLKSVLGIKGDVVAVDGKAVRGIPNKTLQIITAYITDSGVVLGQESVSEKTNEIPVFQEMLSYLDVEGKTVTADALHCQRETCEAVCGRKGDYVFGLKGNQRAMHNDVKEFFEGCRADEVEEYAETEKNFGRTETRICRKIKDINWLNERHGWPGLKSVFAIERIVSRGENEISRETGFYISSRDADAVELASLVREHWKIESMHWMLDVVFSEDARKYASENAHRTLNAMRKSALALHKNYIAKSGKKCTIKRSMLSCLLNTQKICELLESL